MAKKTIDNTILEYMKKGNRINQWNSYELFQYTRLSATIFNLKAKGYIIKKSGKKLGQTQWTTQYLFLVIRKGRVYAYIINDKV